MTGTKPAGTVYSTGAQSGRLMASAGSSNTPAIESIQTRWRVAADMRFASAIWSAAAAPSTRVTLANMEMTIIGMAALESWRIFSP